MLARLFQSSQALQDDVDEEPARADEGGTVAPRDPFELRARVEVFLHEAVGELGPLREHEAVVGRRSGSHAARKGVGRLPERRTKLRVLRERAYFLLQRVDYHAPHVLVNRTQRVESELILERPGGENCWGCGNEQGNHRKVVVRVARGSDGGASAVAYVCSNCI